MKFETRKTLDKILGIIEANGKGDGNRGRRKGGRGRGPGRNSGGRGRGLGPGDDDENAYDDGKNWRRKKGQCPFDEMTSAERKKISDKDFVFPDERTWPIHDKEHAKIALTWASWPKHKDVASKVRSAVYKKYPELKKKDEGNTKKSLNQLGNIIEAIKGTSGNRTLGEKSNNSSIGSMFASFISDMDRRYNVDIINDFIDKIVKGLRVLKKLNLDQGDDYIDIVKNVQDMRESLAIYLKDLAKLMKSVDAVARKYK